MSNKYHIKMNQNVLQLFAFLRQKNALIPFIINLFTDTSMWSLPNIKALNDQGSVCMLGEAFAWEDSFEGDAYWDKLDNEFDEIVNNGTDINGEWLKPISPPKPSVGYTQDEKQAKFLDFLRERGALVSYILGVQAREKKFGRSGPLKKVMDGQKSVYNWMALFSWADTAEDWAYWNDIDDDWYRTTVGLPTRTKATV